MTWSTIKPYDLAEYKAWIGDDSVDDTDDEDVYFEGKKRPTFVDTYTDVNEYTWPPLHFVDDGCWSNGIEA